MTTIIGPISKLLSLIGKMSSEAVFCLKPGQTMGEVFLFGPGARGGRKGPLGMMNRARDIAGVVLKILGQFKVGPV